VTGPEPLLRVEDLRIRFRTDAGPVRAVDGVSFEIPRGATLAVVGESGCGKSVTALSILRLLPEPPAEIASGRIEFEGEDLLGVDAARMRSIRGNDIAMIFQEPMSCLNPVYTVGDQVAEAILAHRAASTDDARREAIALLGRVGIPEPGHRIDEYPHQMSGGMRQRVMVAMALACDPKLLIADEPTTALDVTIQAQILELLRKLQAELGMSVLLITHDLGVVAELAQRVVVMYAGAIVEEAAVLDLFDRPRHPYTAGLLRSIASFDAEAEAPRPIAGSVPDALHLPGGCRFHPRCPYAMARCEAEEPRLETIAATAGSSLPHRSACWVVEADASLDLLAAAPHPPGEGR
jgi:oligopeptide/dipeptide ABC transporter ATP-binding protein